MIKPFHIKAGYLIDGSGGPLRKDVTVKITNDRIESVTESIAPESFSSQGIDLSGFTILPCLIEGHAHLFISGTSDQEVRRKELDAPFESAKSIIKKNLDQYLDHGILAIRDGGDFGGYALRYKIDIFSNESTPMHLHTAGRAWHMQDRYGKMMGRPVPEGRALSHAIAESKEPVDHIKIINSGMNSLKQFGKQTHPQFDTDQIRDAVKEADRLGLKTMVHANGVDPVKAAIEGGCHSIEHGYLMGRDNLKRMADKGIIWVPTLVPMAALEKLHQKNSIESRNAKKYVDHQLEQIGLALDYGVTMAIGTDAGSLGVMHGCSVYEEISLFIKAGLSMEQAVQCATSNGAKLMGIENQISTIAPGNQATFIAFKGNITDSKYIFSKPDQIYINGKKYLRPVP